MLEKGRPYTSVRTGWRYIAISETKLISWCKEDRQWRRQNVQDSRIFEAQSWPQNVQALMYHLGCDVAALDKLFDDHFPLPRGCLKMEAGCICVPAPAPEEEAKVCWDCSEPEQHCVCYLLDMADKIAEEEQTQKMLKEYTAKVVEIARERRALKERLPDKDTYFL